MENTPIAPTTTHQTSIIARIEHAAEADIQAIITAIEKLFHGHNHDKVTLQAQTVSVPQTTVITPVSPVATAPSVPATPAPSAPPA